MTTTKTKYLEDSIRNGYTSEDVRMWQALCEQAKTEIGPSVYHLWTVIDIAKNTHCDVLDVIKMGRVVSEQKNVNEKFMRAVFMSMASQDDGPECEEELSDSGSYETEGNERLTSATCYDIDDDVTDKTDPPTRVSSTPSAGKRKHLASIPEE